MIALPIIFGLVIAGVIAGVGWLHWRGIARFGQRGPAWGLGTMLLGLLQLVAWLLLPGDPTLWLRPVIAVAAMLATVLLGLYRRSRG